MTWLTRGRLRIIAYHDVRDQAAFAQQLAHISETYRPVTADDVRAAVHGAPLPPKAVWITFDDAAPDVVDLAMPLLDAAGVQATIFVCPGVVDTTTPYWFQLTDLAIAHGVHERVARGQPAPLFRLGLKSLSDVHRRAVVTSLEDALALRGVSMSTQQLTTDQLRLWASHGHAWGNHSWDHPLLDHCTEDEQLQQVERSHEWLESVLPDGGTPLFAYPNGNPAPAAGARLRQLGYLPPLLFDHRLAEPSAETFSRLRLDAYAPLDRARCVLSGTHSTMLGVQRALRRG